MNTNNQKVELSDSEIQQFIDKFTVTTTLSDFKVIAAFFQTLSLSSMKKVMDGVNDYMMQKMQESGQEFTAEQLQTFSAIVGDFMKSEDGTPGTDLSRLDEAQAALEAAIAEKDLARGYSWPIKFEPYKFPPADSDSVH